MKIYNTIHADLLSAQKLAYAPSGLLLKNVTQEAESLEYGACKFELNNHRIIFRVAKITPKKLGQFVTLWKRNGTGPILPYDVADVIDFFVVSVRSDEHLGQFIFPKSVLFEKGILSKDGKGGKRAMRVYPPWDIVESQQAKKTQAWQIMFFFEIKSANTDSAIIQRLFC